MDKKKKSPSKVIAKRKKDASKAFKKYNEEARRAMKKGNLEFAFLKDPIMVGQMYGYDVVGFNKQNHLQKLFTDFTRSLPKDRKVSAEFISGMARYMDDIYTMSTKGYADRPDWVNSALHTIGSALSLIHI